MAWSLTNVFIQIVAGILGGHAAAAAAKGHIFGAFGHTLAGAVAGGIATLIVGFLKHSVDQHRS